MPKTMLIELDKEDAISLVKGTSPNYEIMSHPTIRQFGTFYDYQSRWEWNTSSLSNLKVDQLLYIYRICKNSWK